MDRYISCVGYSKTAHVILFNRAINTVTTIKLSSKCVPLPIKKEKVDVFRSSVNKGDID